MIITIDGPAGVGKSSVSRALSRAIRLPYVDTGAMFRVVALAAKQEGVDWQDQDALYALIQKCTLSFQVRDEEEVLLLNGENVEHLIRDPMIAQGASQIAVHPKIRMHLLALQREIGTKTGGLFEGRDMGTVVFPDADLKFFLDADVKERALRRWKQGRGTTEEQVEEIANALKRRDQTDTERQIAPLKRPEDAVFVDTTHLSFDEVVSQLLRCIQKLKKQPKNAKIP